MYYTNTKYLSIYEGANGGNCKQGFGHIIWQVTVKGDLPWNISEGGFGHIINSEQGFGLKMAAKWEMA